MARALSKKRRFDVFKRDGFTCQYCGGKPPSVVLEVDHVLAVANGGTDEDHNLITACFDCNRGKGVGDLTVAPIDVIAKGALLKEKREQLEAYNLLLAQLRNKEDGDVRQVVAVYESYFEKWTLSAEGQRSVRRFLKELAPVEVMEAMDMACSRMPRERVFKYFCGVCWRKIKGDGSYP